MRCLAMRCLVIFFSLSVFAGCTSTLLERATLVVPENSSGKISTNEDRVKGSSCRNSYGLINLLQIQPGKTPPNVDEAIKDALSKAPESNALVDAKIKTRNTYAVFYGKSCFEVEGNPARL